MINTECPHCGEKYSLDDKLLGRKAKCKVCKKEFIIDNPESFIKKEKRIIEKSPDLELKPNKISFILFSNPLILIFSIIAIFGLFVSIYITLGLFILVLLLFVWENIKYKKEKYILTDRKIIYHNGNLISDNSTEIKLDKITEVKASIPFLQRIFFKTGNVLIQTAGAGSSKIKLSNINDTMKVYEEFRKRMQKNGFHLQKEKLVQTEKPHMIGVLGEVFSKSFGVIIFIFYFGILMIDKLGEIGNNGFEFIGSIIGLLGFIIFFSFILISYLDLKQRRYEIFADSVWYHEGFLNKHYAFIPMEVVADVENTQSFFSKIFGLHDIVISSAGASNKVTFKNMINGETMIKNLRYLKDHIVMSEKDSIKGEEKTANSLIGFKDKIEQPLDFDKEFEGHYRMNVAKTIIETLPSIIFPPLFIVIVIGRLIQLKCTDYDIKQTSIEKKFDLFSTKFNSFSIEKITGVQIKQSFVDKWLGTCSIKFWSIGSGTPITFENIKKTKGLEEQVLAKVGIRKEEKVGDIEIDFSLMNFLKANILISLFLILLFPITILIFIYQKIFFAQKRYFREIYKNYIKTQNGIFFITKKYVLFRHIKGIKSTKYPFTNTGKLYLNVAGETEVATANKQKGNLIILLINLISGKKASSTTSLFSNAVDIKYIKNVFSSHNKLDNILNGETINNEKLAETKQDVINSVLPMILLIIPIIFIPLMIWVIKVRYWIFEKNRVLYGSGIIYKKRQSILYHKFNFIDLKRGFLNKIFKNGSINIYTLGSSGVDMTIKNTKDYSKIYELLKID